MFLFFLTQQPFFSCIFGTHKEKIKTKCKINNVNVNLHGYFTNNAYLHHFWMFCRSSDNGNGDVCCNGVAEKWVFLCGFGLNYGFVLVKYLMLSLCGGFRVCKAYLMRERERERERESIHMNNNCVKKLKRKENQKQVNKTRHFIWLYTSLTLLSY